VGGYIYAWLVRRQTYLRSFRASLPSNGTTLHCLVRETPVRQMSVQPCLFHAILGSETRTCDLMTWHQTSKRQTVTNWRQKTNTLHTLEWCTQWIGPVGGVNAVKLQVWRLDIFQQQHHRHMVNCCTYITVISLSRVISSNKMIHYLMIFRHLWKNGRYSQPCTNTAKQHIVPHACQQ